jgi:ubiquinone/menaquinone biosynthesis C-methylase UbiE
VSIIFAALYDRAVAHAERRGLCAWRAKLLEGLRGVVLDAGAGTGANISAFSALATKILLAEPDSAMRSKLAEKVARTGDPRVEIIDAPFEQLPLPDGSLDAVVSTLVLCTVKNPGAALHEARRVLRPGGRLAFIEHVAAPVGSTRSKLQKVVQPIWGPIADGCHLTRDTEQSILDAGFRMESIAREEIPTPFLLIRPSIRGIAVSP